MKSNQTKNVATLSILSFLIVAASVNISESAFACDVTSHCYASAQRTLANDGNKATVTIPNLSIPNTCGVGTTEFTALPQWVIMNTLRTDWIEVGVGQGKLAGSCYNSETVYTFVSINGGGGWGIHRTVNIGSDYTFSLDDTATNTTWLIKDASLPSPLRSVSTTYSNGKGEIGAEQTHNSNTSIPVTHLKSISYYSSGWNLWASNVLLQTPNAPLWRTVCTNFNHIHVGTGTPQTC